MSKRCMTQVGLGVILFYCIAGITLEGYSPLGNPSLPVRGEDDPNVFSDPLIKEIAEKHKASVAQVDPGSGLDFVLPIASFTTFVNGALEYVVCQCGVSSLFDFNRYALPLLFNVAWL